ncbi:MAG: glycine cleavage system aminomethyltransferase GcvT [Acidobacteria bacterium]|nr:MAG: glycine cleavage system aminomethyltransferase GcvT [Acidobacteriota bacterium]
MTDLKRTPLHGAHERLGARLVEFAGYSMPVQYRSVLEEHRAVREGAGLFDVSHMGQIYLEGTGAIASTERLLSRPVASLKPGRVRYGLLCNQEGGIVDDVTFYRTGDDAIFLCVNAANVEKDYRWGVRFALDDTVIRNRSDETGLLALQGPASPEVLARVSSPTVKELKRYAFTQIEVAGCDALVSRTGYTGSDGYEIYLAATETERVFEALLAEGKPLGLIPAGLGARDTLRLEAAMPLYGHELDDTTSPFEAGLGKFVKLDRGGFIGAEAIARREAEGRPRQLVGFELSERGIARAGYAVAVHGETVGVVTSGGPSPTLGKSIGLGYVPPRLAEPGTLLDIVIRGRAVSGRVVETPFVKASG